MSSPHYCDVIVGMMASQITSLTIVSTVYSDADQIKHQRSASLAFVRGIHRGPVIYPHKWPVTRKMFQFDDVIMFFGENYQSLEEYFPLNRSAKQTFDSAFVVRLIKPANK